MAGSLGLPGLMQHGRHYPLPPDARQSIGVGSASWCRMVLSWVQCPVDCCAAMYCVFGQSRLYVGKANPVRRGISMSKDVAANDALVSVEGSGGRLSEVVLELFRLSCPMSLIRSLVHSLPKSPFGTFGSDSRLCFSQLW